MEQKETKGMCESNLCHPKNRVALARAFGHNPPMLARVLCAALSAVVKRTCRPVAPTGAKAEAFPVGVEVNCGWGDNISVAVGLPDAAVKESSDRVTTALTNSGFEVPMGRSTINLAPAHVGKSDQTFDDDSDMAKSKAGNWSRARWKSRRCAGTTPCCFVQLPCKQKTNRTMV
jgi:hypothetical protein